MNESYMYNSSKFDTKRKGMKKKRPPTKLNNLQTGSLGWAPTPSQYFALELSKAMSLNGFGDFASSGTSVGFFGIGL